MPDPQSDLLTIAALYVFSAATTNDILAEHAWNLAAEQAEVHGLGIEDAVFNLEYIRPEALSTESR